MVLLYIMPFYYALVEVLCNFGLWTDFGIKVIGTLEINAGILCRWRHKTMTCNPITGKNGTHYIFQNGLTSDEKDFYKDLDMKK